MSNFGNIMVNKTDIPAKNLLQDANRISLVEPENLMLFCGIAETHELETEGLNCITCLVQGPYVQKKLHNKSSLPFLFLAFSQVFGH